MPRDRAKTLRGCAVEMEKNYLAACAFTFLSRRRTHRGRFIMGRPRFADNSEKTSFPFSLGASFISPLAGNGHSVARPGKDTGLADKVQ